MAETYGQSVRSPWATGDLRAMFVRDAVEARGYVVFPDESDPEPEQDIYNASADPDYQPPPGSRRPPRSNESALTAIADAMGTSVDELGDDVHFDEDLAFDILNNELADPQAAFDAIAGSDAGPTWRAKEGSFMAEKGLTNRRSPGHVRPSRTPEARRKRHLQGLVDAGKYPDLATAEAMTQRRGGNKRP